MSNVEGRLQKCILIGEPVEQSLSPSMHNAGLHAVGLDDKFVYDRQKVTADQLPLFLHECVENDVRGLSVTTPLKELIVKHLDEVDSLAQKIGAVNTVVFERGRSRGYNTDWWGVVGPLEERGMITGKQVALLGAGGAARAALFGLLERAATVTIFNRSYEKAQVIARQFGCDVMSWAHIEDLPMYDIVVNMTSVGLGEDKSPIPKECLRKGQVVVESIYHPRETRLLKLAREQGCQVVVGVEMLLYQGIAQFEYFTGTDAPVEVMRAALKENIKQVH